MNVFYEKGTISLRWSVLLVVLVTLVSMVALISLRDERNLFAEAWTRLTHSSAARTWTQKPQTAIGKVQRAIEGEPAVVRKCVVKGVTLYSNVECGGKDARAHEIDLHYTQGIEPPKVAESPAAAARVTQNDAVDKIVQQATSPHANDGNR